MIAEEERFTRHKHAPWEPPVNAVKYCLEEAGIDPGDLAAVAVGTDVDRYMAWAKLDATSQLRIDAVDRLFPPSLFANTASLPAFTVVDHHRSHAASAFYASGFDDAAFLVLDNRGEDVSATLGHGGARGLAILDQFSPFHSLGLFYQTAASFTGLGGVSRDRDGRMTAITDASGKFMGLASYGSPNQPLPLQLVDGRPEFVGLALPTDVTPDERRLALGRAMFAYFEEHCFPYEAGLLDEPLTYADFAASVQKRIEEIILAFCSRLRRQTGSRNLVLAGGVALNCTANGVIAESGLFENLYVQPMAGDSGTALGAAYVIACALTPGRRDVAPMRHAYWGPAADDAEIVAALSAAGLPAEPLPRQHLVARTAAILADHAIVGWFQGRAEVGPRALGARSLLASPCKRSATARLNLIKGREMWRPVAPSVPAEDFDRLLQGEPPVALHDRRRHGSPGRAAHDTGGGSLRRQRSPPGSGSRGQPALLGSAPGV